MLDTPVEADGTATPLRERWVAFALTGADLLVEANAEGVIGFAARPFRVRFGAEPESFVGQRATTLIAPQDQAAFGVTLSMAALHGRTNPVVLHLNDANRTPCAVAAMLVPAPHKRLLLTFGPLPTVLPARPRPEPARLDSSGPFGREAEEWLRGAASGSLGLVEVRGWNRGQGGDVDARGEWAAGADWPSAGGNAPRQSGRRTVRAAVRRAQRRPAGWGRAGPRGDGAAARRRCASGNGCRRARLGAQRAWADTIPGRPRHALRARTVCPGRHRGGAGGKQRPRGLAGVIAGAQARARGLRTAIRERQFGLDFRPVVSLDDGNVHHHEALLRPCRGSAAAGTHAAGFVTVAEAVGLSEDLDFAVLELSLAALGRAPGASVAVNVSGLSMQSMAFRTRMMEWIAHGPAVPRPGGRARLIVELTETAEIGDVAGAAATIRQLRAAGVPVCVDDFGAGNAAFRYLRAFAVDFVKIDGSYVQLCAERAAQRAGARLRRLDGTTGSLGRRARGGGDDRDRGTGEVDGGVAGRVRAGVAVRAAWKAGGWVMGRRVWLVAGFDRLLTFAAGGPARFKMGRVVPPHDFS